MPTVSSAAEFFELFRDFLLTEKEAAHILKVSVKTLQSWRLKGQGPRFRKLSRVVRYKLDDIQKFIESSGRGSTSEAA